MDPFDESEDQYEERSERYIDPILCACDEPTAGESCGFCGEPLCPACFEMGGGFCNKQHSQAEMEAYAEDMGFNERQEQKVKWP